MQAAAATHEIVLEFGIEQETIDLWAELSEDHNPLHVDPAYAATSRFGSTIAHGQLALAFVTELLGRELGEEWCRHGALRNVRFRAPLRPRRRYRLTAHPRGERWHFELRDRDSNRLCVEGWVD
ncbi:MAG TPA: MaoC/PaaZ C-terminal domain-containing protein [Solirubrobacterales bacterium]|nr:MaoC/PaaZ C-terminal domain-containing protein [Solirubrobacterales bacterium]